MTLFAAPVGYGYSTAYAPATTFTGDKKINPHKDSVFIDPRTGELITIQPGIYDPEKTEKKGKGGLIALGATIAAAALAFVFRGKIKNIPFVKNTVMPALTKGWTATKNFAGKAVTTVKNLATKGWTAVKTFAGKAWNTVKGFFKKAPAATP